VLPAQHQRLQPAPLLPGALLPPLPLRERGLRLLPACPRPHRIDQLHPEEELTAPPGLPQHLLRSQHKAGIIGDLCLWCWCAGLRHTASRWTIPVLSQEPTGLILVLLRDHLPALIAQQRDEQPTRRISHPLCVHRCGHHVELGRLAALQPAAGNGLLVQGEQTSDITQVSEDHIA
jgi:hypothetical protein